MMWKDKNNPNVLYMDIRQEEKGFNKYRRSQEVQPDLIGDFRDMPFKDKTFKMVVWDPPHLTKLGETSHFYKIFGKLHNETWPYDLGQGFKECWRVLEDYGVLIFKFNNGNIPYKKVLALFKEQHLFAHTNDSKGKSLTSWFVFMKIPKK